MKSVAEFSLVCILLVLCSGAGNGQHKVWEVPANSTGNRLVLTVENSGGADIENGMLVLIGVPVYLHFEPSELSLKTLPPGGSQEVTLEFSIDRSAPAKKIDRITVEVQSTTAQWQKELSFTYLEPTSYRLEQNYPNPFNPSTTIRYQLPVEGQVTLVLYEMLGREVEKLVDERKEAGYYESLWEARTLASGMYFYRLVVRGQDGSTYSDVRKMLFLK